MVGVTFKGMTSIVQLGILYLKTLLVSSNIQITDSIVTVIEYRCLRSLPCIYNTIKDTNELFTSNALCSTIPDFVKLLKGGRSCQITT